MEKPGSEGPSRQAQAGAGRGRAVQAGGCWGSKKGQPAAGVMWAEQGPACPQTPHPLHPRPWAPSARATQLLCRSGRAQRPEHSAHPAHKMHLPQLWSALRPQLRESDSVKGTKETLQAHLSSTPPCSVRTRFRTCLGPAWPGRMLEHQHQVNCSIMDRVLMSGNNRQLGDCSLSAG